MTTIDHADEARGLWDNLHEWQEQEGDTDETRLVQAIEAHAHETAAATLALVEQQRIANLIDLSRAPRATILGEQPANDALQGLAEFREHEPAELGGWYELRPNIKKGLGL